MLCQARPASMVPPGHPGRMPPCHGRSTPSPTHWTIGNQSRGDPSVSMSSEALGLPLHIVLACSVPKPPIGPVCPIWGPPLDRLGSTLYSGAGCYQEAGGCLFCPEVHNSSQRWAALDTVVTRDTGGCSYHLMIPNTTKQTTTITTQVVARRIKKYILDKESLETYII